MTLSQTNGTDQLAALFPEPTIITIAGRDVVVREMPVRKIAKFSSLLAPVLARYPEGARIQSDAFFLAAGEAGIEAVAFAIDQPMDWVGELPAVQFETIVVALHEANRSFFANGVGLLVSVAMATTFRMAKAATAADGQPSSDVSLSTATVTPASTH